MAVSFDFGVLYIWYQSYVYWPLGNRTMLLCLVFRLGTVIRHICRHGNNWLSKSDIIYPFGIFRFFHMLTDIAAVEGYLSIFVVCVLLIRICVGSKVMFYVCLIHIGILYFWSIIWDRRHFNCNTMLLCIVFSVSELWLCTCVSAGIIDYVSRILFRRFCPSTYPVLTDLWTPGSRFLVRFMLLPSFLHTCIETGINDCVGNISLVFLFSVSILCLMTIQV